MPLERKFERDIDIFLAEEFSVSPTFAAWFLSQTKVFSGLNASVVDVFVSKSDNTGESDLVVIFKDAQDDERFAVLIEDNIDAPFQERQAERYRLRAQGEVGKGLYVKAAIILCAPNNYLTQTEHREDFDSVVSYEQIAQFLKDVYPPTERSLYRANFIGTAATGKINRYERVDDPITNAFWDAVYHLASSKFHKLEMKKVQFTKNSSWITFRPSDMPTQPKLINVALKAALGFVDLTLSSTSNVSFQPRVESVLDPGMSAHQIGKSAAIRLEVPSFRVNPDIQATLPKIEEALAAAARLVDFYREHHQFLDRAAAQSPYYER